MSNTVYYGVFGTETDILDATKTAKAKGCEIIDTFTPYAVHGLNDAQGLAPSRMTWVCFLLGLFGFTVAVTMMYWMNSYDWPINIGGKPHNSWPAFVPIAFELTVLHAALGSVAVLLIRSGLLPGKEAKLAHPGVTNDKFVIALKQNNIATDKDAVAALFADFDALEITESANAGNGDAC
jgi:hypothetical protein